MPFVADLYTVYTLVYWLVYMYPTTRNMETHIVSLWFSPVSSWFQLTGFCPWFAYLSFGLWHTEIHLYPSFQCLQTSDKILHQMSLWSSLPHPNNPWKHVCHTYQSWWKGNSLYTQVNYHFETNCHEWKLTKVSKRIPKWSTSPFPSSSMSASFVLTPGISIPTLHIRNLSGVPVVWGPRNTPELYLATSTLSLTCLK